MKWWANTAGAGQIRGGRVHRGRDRRRRARITSGACLAAVATTATVVGVATPAGADLPNGNTTTDWGNNDLVGCAGDSTGGYVVAVQDYFWGAGFPITAVDDKYGTNSQNAVKFFQGLVGLTVDGCAGPNTWRRMQSLLATGGGGFYSTSSTNRLGGFASPSVSGCGGIWATLVNSSPTPPVGSPVSASKDYKFQRTLTTSGC